MVDNDGAVHVCLEVPIFSNSSKRATDIRMIKTVTGICLRAQKNFAILCICFVIWNPKPNNTMASIVKS